MIQLRSCLCGILLLSLTAAIPSSAQTFTTLKVFNVTDGALPQGTLVQGLDGNFYGTTVQGGRQAICDGGCGTVFKITPEGTLTSLYKFFGTEGSYPYAGLVLATNGNFYGAAAGGSKYGMFEITPDGTLTMLNSTFAFGAALEDTSLVQDTITGNFYGTNGNIFEMTPDGDVTILHNFCPDYPKCSLASSSALGALAWNVDDGLFYGVTRFGGITKGGFGNACVEYGCGTVFVIGPGGALKTLYRFTGETDGESPLAGLVQGTDGNFYGTTSNGGAQDGAGTVFKITPSGTLSTIYRFLCPQNKCADGGSPNSRLVQASDGNFYGTTIAGGLSVPKLPYGGGTVFQLTPDGVLTTIHYFCASGVPCSDGAMPAGLTQGTDGDLYGLVTGSDGTNLTVGTVYKISLGLPPFVKTLQPGARPGTVITILGTDLTGATSVTVNGAAADFTVVSATEITATVPADATTGTVEVTTPRGTLKSNVAFRVL
jgi:uncharacterized repeat protein (TIGR03803 family)